MVSSAGLPAFANTPGHTVPPHRFVNVNVVAPDTNVVPWKKDMKTNRRRQTMEEDEAAEEAIARTYTPAGNIKPLIRTKLM